MIRTRRLLALPFAATLWMATATATYAAPDEAIVPERPDAIALARLDGFAQGMQTAGAFSGVVLVGAGDAVVFRRGYGKPDAQNAVGGADIDPNTRFNLASAGKMFTSVAILQQIAQQRLSLDTTVATVLRDYRNTQFARTVTVRQLLTHTAGAGDIDELFGAENAPRRGGLRTIAQMLALHDDRAPEFTPESAQKYGNFGYIILGRMVEVLSGQSFEDYLQQHVFDPARMTHTGFVECSDSAADVAIGYANVNGNRVRNCATQPQRGFAAGGQVSTAADMFLFVQALRAGRLLPPELLREATRPQYEFMG